MNLNLGTFARHLGFTALLLGVSSLGACSNSRQPIPPTQPTAARHAMSQDTCTSNCAATLLVPLRASIADGVATLTPGDTYCDGTNTTTGYQNTIQPGTVLDIAAVDIPFSCTIAPGDESDYYIIVTPRNINDTVTPAVPVAGPGSVEDSPQSLQFSEADNVPITSGKVFFYLAYCPTCTTGGK